jgi:hypothetical protein
MLDLLTWTPAGFFFGIVGILMVPFLGALVVLTVALGALAALIGAIGVGSYWLARTIGLRWRKPAEAVPGCNSGSGQSLTSRSCFVTAEPLSTCVRSCTNLLEQTAKGDG